MCVLVKNSFFYLLSLKYLTLRNYMPREYSHQHNLILHKIFFLASSRIDAPLTYVLRTTRTHYKSSKYIVMTSPSRSLPPYYYTLVTALKLRKEMSSPSPERIPTLSATRQPTICSITCSFRPFIYALLSWLTYSHPSISYILT